MTDPDSDTAGKTGNRPATIRPKDAMPVYMVDTDCDAESHSLEDVMETVGILIRGWRWFAVILAITGIVTYVLLRSTSAEYESNLRLANTVVLDEDKRMVGIASYMPFFSPDSDALNIFEELELRKPNGKAYLRKEAVSRIKVTSATEDNAINVSARYSSSPIAKRMVERQVEKGLERIRNLVVADLQQKIIDWESRVAVLKAELNVVVENQDSIRIPAKDALSSPGIRPEGKTSGEPASRGPVDERRGDRATIVLWEQSAAIEGEIATLESRVAAAKQRIAANDLRLPIVKIAEASMPTEPVPQKRGLILVLSLVCACMGTSVVLLLRDAMLKKIRSRGV